MAEGIDSRQGAAGSRPAAAHGSTDPASQFDGRDGFAQVLRAEWIKFRTVRGWVIGIIVAAPSTRPGSAYAAIMITPGHGVRMQDNYTQDTAGLPGAVRRDA